ncbi:unnamed protein product [Paramecium sonneborni]|uniref:Transmembrane protein n=1 Tax=Paramecium sonneborni TaxID=65129 RepID=A0A8S1REJ4_9CILI|nr:unnamed protein product [Paramecium sonneborni]
MFFETQLFFYCNYQFNDLTIFHFWNLYIINLNCIISFLVNMHNFHFYQCEQWEIKIQFLLYVQILDAKYYYDSKRRNEVKLLK